MRRVIASEFMTLDGVMQSPGAPDEDTSGGFSLGGWIAHYWDDKMEKMLGALTSKPYDLLIGRKTYEIFAAFWPNVHDDPTAAGLNKATKYVASRTLKTLEWQPAQLLGADIGNGVAELKRGTGPDLLVFGSGDLLQTLFQHKLVDEILLYTFPMILGTGKRLFRDDTAPTGFELKESATSTTGVQLATYKAGAEIRFGTASPEPKK